MKVQPVRVATRRDKHALGALLVTLEDGHDLGQCLVVADVACEPAVPLAPGHGRSVLAIGC
jgi:hypothetical protein